MENRTFIYGFILASVGLLAATSCVVDLEENPLQWEDWIGAIASVYISWKGFNKIEKTVL